MVLARDFNTDRKRASTTSQKYNPQHSLLDRKRDDGRTVKKINKINWKIKFIKCDIGILRAWQWRWLETPSSRFTLTPVTPTFPTTSSQRVAPYPLLFGRSQLGLPEGLRWIDLRAPCWTFCYGFCGHFVRQFAIVASGFICFFSESTYICIYVYVYIFNKFENFTKYKIYIQKNVKGKICKQTKKKFLFT